MLVAWVPCARAQRLPGTFEAAWMGFDTGVFSEAFAPTSLALGDMDSDGDLDAVVAQSHFGAPGVSVLANLGNGTFDRPVHRILAFNQSVAAVALFDVDGDGDRDVVGTIPGGDGLLAQLGLWRNDGSGALAALEQFPAGSGPRGLAVADFTGDGFLDVVTADYGFLGLGTTVSLLAHNGSSGAAAGFRAPRPFTVGVGPLAVAAGDVDGDGRIDLAVAARDASGNWIEVLRNAGAGGFGAPVPYAVGGRGHPVVGLVDLEPNGRLDLVTSYLGSSGSYDFGVIEIRRGTGGGSFGAPEIYSLDNWSSPAHALAFGDLDGDGRIDIVSANPTGRSFEGFRVLRADGAGGFLAAEAYPASQSTADLALADFDGDGHLDLATVATSSAALTVHRNPGTGRFPLPPTAPVSGAEGMASADLDGDGDLDVVTTGDSVDILLNRGDGTFAAAVRYLPPLNPADVALRDLDGDGFPDLVLGPDADYPPYQLATAQNRGDGTFLPGRLWLVNSCGEGHVDAFDLDADGDLDVVLTEEQTCPGSGPGRIFIFRNDGRGGLTRASDLAAYTTPVDVVAADLDGDGRLDLVTMEAGYGLGVFPGNGNLTFGPELRSGTAGFRWALADLDGDGHLDAALTISAASFGTDQVGVCRGRGDGTFDPAVLYHGSSVLENLRIAVDIDAGDVDCDGDFDLLVTNYASNDIGLFVNRDDGTLEPQVRYGPGLTPVASVVGDFNGDGESDLVTAVWEGPFCCGTAVALLVGRCGGCAVPDVIPPDQGNVLRAVRRGLDVELTWAGTAASRWRTYRDPSKLVLGRTPLVPDTTAPIFVDPGAVPASSRDYYRIKGLSPCTGTAGP